MRRFGLLVTIVLLAGACGGDDDTGTDPATPAPDPTTAATDAPTDTGTDAETAEQGLVVTSTAFAEGETIPVEHTCDGANTPPPLTWSGVPEAAAGLALVVDDPDAPGGTFLHWLVALDPDATTAPPADAGLENDTGTTGYFGPCPPAGDEPHRYRFTVVALDAPLEAGTAADAQAALAEHEIARARLTGVYGR